VEELNTTNEDLEARSVELRRSSRLFDEQRNRADADRVRTERLLDRLGQGVGIYDPAGQLIIANQPFRDAVGGSATILAPDGGPLAADALPTARAARGERFTERVVVRQRKGDSGTFEVTASDLGADDPGYSLLEIRPVD
jgi:two-component system CheB/CheR fusion protein